MFSCHVNSSNLYQSICFICFNINPVWNEELTLPTTTAAAPGTLKVEVFERHRFKADDKMGDVEIALQPLVASMRMKKFLKGAKTATKVRKLVPSEDNYLAEESYIHYVDGDIVHTMCLRLDNLLYGDLYMQLKWVDLPGAGSGR